MSRYNFTSLSAIASDRETAEDLLASAVRFRQVVALWELGQAYPESALSAVLKKQHDLLFNVLARLLSGPSLRWEKLRDGSMRGSFVDISIEARIGFLIDVGAEYQLSQFADLAIEAAKQLAASWDYEFPEFRAATRLLSKIGRTNGSFRTAGAKYIERSSTV